MKRKQHLRSHRIQIENLELGLRLALVIFKLFWALVLVSRL